MRVGGLERLDPKVEVAFHRSGRDNVTGVISLGEAVEKLGGGTQRLQHELLAHRLFSGSKQRGGGE
jgi:hypothetical protein